MSSHRKTDVDLVDLSLRHTLKNWVGRSQPPVDGKSRLINAAFQTRRDFSRKKLSKISGLISMSRQENFIEVYLVSFKISPFYSLQPGSIGLNYSHSVNAK